jgi:predicted metal-dependent HD superfamily phosphohydrolase
MEPRAMSSEARNLWAHERWRRLWRGLGVASAPLAALEDLLAAYSEAHRAYHTLDHIIESLALFDEVAAAAVHPLEVEAALWFHDAVYDPRRGDNEERSAEWAARTLREGGVDEAIARRVGALIRATRHRAPPQTSDEALLLDIDLAILGSDAARFRRYDRGIRAEYAFVPEPDYRAARARILQGFLERTPIYRTEALRDRYEERARRNLARALRG